MEYKYKFNEDRCWIKDANICNHKCSKMCIPYRELDYLYFLSNMPKKYQHDAPLMPCKEDLESFKRLKEFQNNIVENINQGKSVLIASGITGNGKTSWACKLMNKYFSIVQKGNGLRCKGVFISCSSFLAELKDDMFNNPNEPSFIYNLKNNAYTCSLLILDDFGISQLSAWELEVISSLLNYRYVNNLSCIFTTNSSKEILTENIEQRNISRVMDMCKDNIYIFKGQDSRREQEVEW